MVTGSKSFMQNKNFKNKKRLWRWAWQLLASRGPLGSTYQLYVNTACVWTLASSFVNLWRCRTQNVGKVSKKQKRSSCFSHCPKGLWKVLSKSAKPVCRWKWTQRLPVFSFSHGCSESFIYVSISYMCSASLTCVQLLSWVLSISHVCSASLSSLQWISSNCIVQVPHTNLHKWKSRSNCGLSRDSGMEDEVQSLSKACRMLPTGLPSLLDPRSRNSALMDSQPYVLSWPAFSV